MLLVGVAGFKLNRELAHYLRELSPSATKPASPVPLYPPPTYRLRVRDRLSEADIAELIHAFKAGTPKHVLTARYGIGVKSVQKLLREEGVKRRSRYDIQP